MTNAQKNLIKNFIKDNWRSSMKEPCGILKYKFLDPAAVYRAQLWDWDSYFCGRALIDVYDDTAEYVKGCALNFLDHIRIDGSIPYMINNQEAECAALPKISREPRTEKSDINSIKPLLAQMVILANSKIKEQDWIKENFYKLKEHIAHWEATQQMPNGLFVWRSYRGSGTDNHPAIYGRPLNSSAGVELNCLMYKEYLAMAEISEICGDKDSAEIYRNKSETLAKAINDYMWDEIDGLYYHLDMQSQKPPLAHQEISWNIPLKFRTWTCFMPMWAGIAPEDRVERMVREHLMNPNEFFSDFGLRTLAKNEPAYSTVETSNPSNWQGPVWIVSTYLMFMGLWNYGYIEEARRVADNLISHLCKDLNENGLLHEYYNPETGESNINPGFMNWNALAGVMADMIDEERTGE